MSQEATKYAVSNRVGLTVRMTAPTSSPPWLRVGAGRQPRPYNKFVDLARCRSTWPFYSRLAQWHYVILNASDWTGVGAFHC